MNRYDHHFRSLPAAIRVNAAQKVGFARAALIQHRGNGFGPEDDDAIVRQFDLSGMAEFWDVVLSEPMECDDFAHALAIHFMIIEHKPGGTDEDRLASGPAAIRVVDMVKVQLRSALRRARIDGEPWFIEIPEPPLSTKLDAKAWLGFVPSDTYIEPPAPPPDGVDLSRLKVRPRAAMDWLIAMPKRQHLVPPSLVKTLRDAAVQTDISVALQTKPKRGRPKGTGLENTDEPIARNMLAMVKTGTHSSLSAAAWALIGRDGKGAEGRGEPQAKVERLVRLANKIDRAENNRG